MIETVIFRSNLRSKVEFSKGRRICDFLFIIYLLFLFYSSLFFNVVLVNIQPLYELLFFFFFLLSLSLLSLSLSLSLSFSPFLSLSLSPSLSQSPSLSLSLYPICSLLVLDVEFITSLKYLNLRF